MTSYNGINIFISYKGGDGNDVTLFTLPYHTTGMDKVPLVNGEMRIGLDTTETLRLPDNLIQNVSGNTYVGYNVNGNGTLDITGENSKYTTKQITKR